MTESAPPVLLVRREEDGMKLALFLRRRLSVAPGVLHKWIRTGQVRLNGGRTKPFTPLACGDAVRLPPFAVPVSGETPPLSPDACASALSRAGLPVVACTEELLVLHKPGGLATHPGSGRTDSVSLRLSAAMGGQPYVPAPAHRLDRQSSGLLLAGRRHRVQQRLHRAFAEGDGITKDYIAWTTGVWEGPSPSLLLDVLRKEESGAPDTRREITRALPGGQTLTPVPENLTISGTGQQEARALLIPLRTLCAREIADLRPRVRGQGASLLLLRLLTGRTHQLRAQLASRGLPIIGDGRHGGPHFPLMLLHAWHVRLSASLAQDLDADQEFSSPLDYTALPAWPPAFLPLERELAPARTRLDGLFPQGAAPAGAFFL